MFRSYLKTVSGLMTSYRCPMLVQICRQSPSKKTTLVTRVACVTTTADTRRRLNAVSLLDRRRRLQESIQHRVNLSSQLCGAVVIMVGPFRPNILSFVWISTLLLFYVEAYFILSFYPIDFKPWQNDP